MEEIKPLAIYSASAGSGKTFSLVQTYLKLTLTKKEGLHSFNKVMAMTFTNKAAWEMKARIIDALSLLSSEVTPLTIRYKKQQELLDITAKTTGLKKEEVHEKSGALLSTILHNYEGFSVSTIDKFSLRLIRTFSKELDIKDDFEVVINEDELIEAVIDELLSNIGIPGYEEVTQLTLNYAKANLDEGDRWNFRRSLVEFAKVLKKEEEQPFIAHILTVDFEASLFQNILSEIHELQKDYEVQKQKLHKVFQEVSLTSEDLPFGKLGLYGYYQNKLLASSLRKPGDIGARGAKTLDGSLIKEKHIFPEVLKEATVNFLAIEKDLVKRHFILDKMRSNFHNLALLKSIAKALEEIKERDNVIRISEFNQMISELLSKEQAPFIYERLGARYDHYLLDEFQDTSRLQWLNLIPLVHDAIAQNNENLIVGDPKQAIYRFRNGLVDQFVALPKIYNPNEDKNLALISRHFDSLGKKHSLNDNWRSQKNIVEFNNTFFELALNTLPEAYKKYYSDVKQNPKGVDGGFVFAKYYDAKKEADFEALERDFILETVRKIEADGFKRGDICLLCRWKSEAKRWAKYLVKAPEKYKVVSADSLFVSADQTVQLFINYLNLRKNPAYSSAQVQFVVGFLQLKDKDPLVVLQNYWKERVGDLDFEYFVNEYFEGDDNFFFDYENLYDLGQRFSNLIGVQELENPYLHHLMEMLQNYDLKFGPDLRGFLDYWSANGAKESIQMPENESSIRIMTVHKAKGLEFPVVILPSLKWAFTTVKDSKFLITEEGSLIQTNLVKDKAPDFVIEAYDKEIEKQLLDEFNLLYVAFTRPVNRLYTLVDVNSSAKETFSNINQLAGSVLRSFPQDQLKVNNDDSFVIGEEIKKFDKESISEEVFQPKDISDFLWFPEMTLQEAETLEDEKESLQIERRFGNQIHVLLSKVNDYDQIKPTAEALINSDQLEHGFVEDAIEIVGKVLNIPFYRSLLKNADVINSEQSIIIGDSETKKPDKIFFVENKVVVLDFKTGAPLNNHKKQVVGYVKALQSMGYENVKGYLLYTKTLSLDLVD